MDAIHSKEDHWFRKMCKDVARHLSEDDVHAISYLYRVHIPAQYTSQFSMALYIFTHLEKEGHLSSDNTGINFLFKMLRELPRCDIVKDCESIIQRNGPTPYSYTHQTHREFITHNSFLCLPMALGLCYMIVFSYFQNYKNT